MRAVEALEARVLFATAPTTADISAVAPPVALGQPRSGAVTSAFPVVSGTDLRGYNGDSTYAFRVLESSASWGDTIHLTFAVANFGTASQSGTYNIDFYIAPTSSIGGADSKKIFTYTGITVPPGSTPGMLNYSAASSVPITLPAVDPIAPASSFWIGMVINPTQSITESNYANNSNQGAGLDENTLAVNPPQAVALTPSTPPTTLAVDFGSVVNDGPGNSSATQNVTLSNSAAKSLLSVLANGVTVTGGTQFHLGNIVGNKSSTFINTAGVNFLAANSAETWTIPVTFDPLSTGVVNDTLQIKTDDPSHTTINFALTGTGTPRPNLVVTDSVPPATDQIVNFGNVKNDGAGGAAGTASVTLTNTGSGPLTVLQNGISLPAGPFAVIGITSNTQGAINLAAGPGTLAAGGAETWTVGLKFDPTVDGLAQQALAILDADPNDPTNKNPLPQATVTLIGTGQSTSRLSVSDSVAPAGDKSVAFGPVPADGPGKQAASQAVTLTDVGAAPLTIGQNGIALAGGTHFKIAGIVSSTQGAIDLAAGSAMLAGSNAESWTVTLQFDPSTAGSLSDTLTIASDDPVSPTTAIALAGTGVNAPLLVVTDSDTPANDLAQGFPPTLADGPGNRSSTRTIQLSNIGTQPLAIPANGIRTVAGTNFQVAGAVSSTGGAVNLSAAGSIAPGGAETWTVTVRFDPQSAAAVSDALRVSSNDPARPTVDVALSGAGAVPAITPAAPGKAVHVSAGNAYRIAWSAAYAPGTATVSLYYDTDQNPAAGLTQIAAGVPQGQGHYDWQVPAALVGGVYTVYAVITDGSVSGGGYAPGSLAVDAAGSDRLLSAPVADTANYTLSYGYSGTTYNAAYPLNPGDNALYPVVNGVAHEYHILRVPTLVDARSNTYDELGAVTSTTDSAGQATQITYDLLKRPVHIAYPDGNFVDYAYDPAGHLLTMHDPTGWQLYAYDTLDRLTGVTYSPTNSAADPAALTIGYGYDLAGRLTSLTYPSGKVVLYGYDSASKLTSVTEKNSGQPDLVTTYTYSPTTGLLAKTTRPNGTETAYGYDASGRLNDIWHRRTSTQALLLRYQYTLDAGGRRTGVVVSSPTGTRAEVYAYDELSRLTQVTYSDDNGTIDPTDRVVKYAYDGNGNRLTQTTYANGVAAGATETLTYAYSFENRLLSVTDQHGVVQARYAYDWRGNQVEKVTPAATTLYGYDTRNLLTSVDDGTNHIEYQYDGAGRRIGQTVNGVATRFVVDPSTAVYQTIEERPSTGGVSADYTYGLDRISERLPGQTARTYFLTDTLQSVGGLTNESGGAGGTYSYDPFGTVRSTTATGTDPFQFAGERVEPFAGLVNLRARVYDPGTGRFLSKDPSGFTDGTNRYAYASNDPINSSDPTGMVTSGLGINGTVVAPPGLGAGISLSAGLLIDSEDVQARIDAVPWYLKIPEAIIAPILSIRAYASIQTAAAGSTGTTPVDLSIAAFNYNGNVASFRTPTQTTTATIPLEEAGVPLSVVTGAITDPQSGRVLGGYFGLGEGAGVASSIGPSHVSPSLSDAVSGAIHGIADFLDLGSTPARADSIDDFGFGTGSSLASSGRPGGVLIDKAATLVGSSLKDIAGATFDPTTHQLVFLGDSSPAAVKNVNLDYFTTAVQSVYGSAVPPYVTLDPPAKLTQPSFNLGDGDGVIANGKSASLIIHYTPDVATEADDMTLRFDLNGVSQSVRIDGYLLDVFSGSHQGSGLTTFSSTGLPSGFTVSMPAKATNNHLHAGDGNSASLSIPGAVFTVNSQTEDSYWAVSLTNNTGQTKTVTNLELIPDLQHRKFGGRVDNTQLGWVMEEADRVMKELAIGEDQLTGAVYDSHNASLPTGFRNVLERSLAAGDGGQQNDRFWFTPNEETLKRYIDPVTGQATVVFDKSSVKLETESLLAGQPEDPQARAFVDFFNAHYDQFAAMSFPVHDPADPTGNSVVMVPIFDRLQDAMKAVALARFFHDNNIPLDTWWINSWKAPTATVPATIPTLSNSATNGQVTVTAYGGVTIKLPNTYNADPTAQIINNSILAQRTAGTGDLPGQSWSATSAAGNFDAVAATLDPVKQDATVRLSATDLSFDSIGQQSLSFRRFYDSGFLADRHMGQGWQPQRFDLQFQYPSLTDDYGLIRDAGGNRLKVYGANADTQIRSGEVRLVDQATGQLLNFTSSLTTRYALDNNANPVIATTGLGAGNVPTFTPGQYKDGSTLAQDPTTRNYTLTHPDSSSLTFDFNGNLLKSTDPLGYALTYNYTSGQLTSITDPSGQAITLAYDAATGRIASVGGPNASGSPQRRVTFQYDSGGRLTEADTQALQSGTTYTTVARTTYAYNANNQISSVTGPDGVTALTSTDDLRGRTTMRKDAMGNMAGFGFTQDAAGNTATTATDMGTTGANDPYAQGTNALKYFPAGSTSSTRFDTGARTTGTTDALGHATAYGYTGTSQLPNSVQLPTPGRPAIGLQRNAANLPTVVTDPANAGATPVQVQYNTANLPTSVTDEKGRVTTYTYTPFNAVQSVTVASGTLLAATTTYFYSANKLLDHVTDPLGHTVVSYTYDPQGRVLTSTDGDGVKTTYQYDTLGRLVKEFDPTLTGATNFVQYVYNDNDQVTSVVTPTGSTGATYDPTTHRLTSERDLNQNTTQYAYDAATGLVTAVTQIAAGGNATTQFAYDRLGRPVLMTAPTGLRTSFRYDALGEQTAMIEDDAAAPAADVSPQVTGGSSMTVNVTASEPAVVAALTYWQDGQSQSAGTTVPLRLDSGTGAAAGGQGAFAFQLTGIDTTKLYHYQLTLTDRAGTTRTLPAGVLLAAPASLTATAGAGQVSLSWSPVAGAASYDVYRGTSAGGESATPYQTGLTGTSFVDTAVTSGAAYFYRVAPVAAGSDGAKSAEAAATTFVVPNTPPKAIGLQTVNAVENATPPSIPLPSFFSDSETASSALAYSVVGDTNMGLFSSTPITASGDLALNLALNAVGTATLTVRATDPGGLYVDTPLTVSVRPAWLSVPAGGAWTVSGPQGGYTLSLTAGTFTINSDPGAQNPGTAVSVAAPASLTLNASAHLASLSLTGGAAATLAGVGANRTAANHHVLVTGALSIDTAAGSKLDLADNDLVLKGGGAAGLAAVQSLISSGYDKHNWNGSGIITSAAAGKTNTALAYALNDGSVIKAKTTFGPNDEPVDPTDVLVKYTWEGDSNLDGQLSFDDYFYIDSKYPKTSNSTWVTGDFDYNGVTSFDDYFYIDSNYPKGTAPWGDLRPGALIRESVGSAGQPANLDSDYPSLSADGRYLAFRSKATNLVPGDTNNAADAFLRDLQTGTTVRMSVTSAGLQAGSGNYGTARISLSEDARSIAFASEAADLIPGSNNNGIADVFLRHVPDPANNPADGQTERVSVAYPGGDPSQASFGSSNPAISADGRHVAFESYSADLAPGDTNGDRDVYVRDLDSGETELVSVTPGGTAGNGYSRVPCISADGRFVAFESAASDLVAGDTNGTGDIFLRDLQTHTTERISYMPGGQQVDGYCRDPAISADGRFVAYYSISSYLTPGDTNGVLNLFVRDLTKSPGEPGATRLVSISPDGKPADLGSFDFGESPASISADGRYVAFWADATNLVTGDNNHARDVFVRDLQTNTTQRVSVGPTGEGNGGSDMPSISADGRYIAFASDATNLLTGADANTSRDVFITLNPLAPHPSGQSVLLLPAAD